MNDECWIPISGWHGLYEVSNFGHIKSLQNQILTGSRNCVIRERILRLRHDKNGYLLVDLQNAGKKVTCKVHRLVAIAFIKNPAIINLVR